MYEIYTIKFGDNINSILDKYSITMDELVKLNGIIDLNNLKEGMQIIVPSMDNGEIYQYYTVEKGDTIYSIAKKFDIDSNLLTKINGLEDNDYIYPNQTVIVPKDGINIYLTSNNDTIKTVLDKLNITMEELVNKNKEVYLKEEQILVF